MQDGLFQQMANISKAGAYDALLPQYTALQEENLVLQDKLASDSMQTMTLALKCGRLEGENKQLTEIRENLSLEIEKYEKANLDLKDVCLEMLGALVNLKTAFSHSIESYIFEKETEIAAKTIEKANTILSPSNTNNNDPK